MRNLKVCGLFFFCVMSIGTYFLAGAHAQTESSDAPAIQDVDAVSNPSAEVVPEGIQGVESVPTAKMAPVVQRSPSGPAAAAVTRKPAEDKEAFSKKQQQDKTIMSILISIGIFIGSVGIFVFIMIYFFKGRLQQLLDKSSKDRKFLGETLKRFNIDIDKILPPGGSMKK